MALEDFAYFNSVPNSISEAVASPEPAASAADFLFRSWMGSFERWSREMNLYEKFKEMTQEPNRIYEDL